MYFDHIHSFPFLPYFLPGPLLPSSALQAYDLCFSFFFLVGTFTKGEDRALRHYVLIDLSPCEKSGLHFFSDQCDLPKTSLIYDKINDFPMY